MEFDPGMAIQSKFHSSQFKYYYNDIQIYTTSKRGKKEGRKKRRRKGEREEGRKVGWKKGLKEGKIMELRERRGKRI